MTAPTSFYNFRFLHANSNDGCVDESSIWWPQEKEAHSADQFDQFYASELISEKCNNFRAQKCVTEIMNIFICTTYFFATYFESDDTNELQGVLKLSAPIVEGSSHNL